MCVGECNHNLLNKVGVKPDLACGIILKSVLRDGLMNRTVKQMVPLPPLPEEIRRNDTCCSP